MIALISFGIFVAACALYWMGYRSGVEAITNETLVEIAQLRSKQDELISKLTALTEGLPALFSDVSQLIDGWSQHKDWTNWDASVRGRLAKAAEQIDKLKNNEP